MSKHVKRVTSVVVAAALVVVLGASLAVRVWARTKPERVPAATTALVPLPATVRAPRPILAADLPTPFCWGCSWNINAPLDFQVDLDLLAPLGDGEANAAMWFERFAVDPAVEQGRGAHAYRERMIEITLDGQSWRILPADDPLLLEAEPWVDQATMSFYPDLWEVDGVETRIPNLLMMLDLARSWTARGKLTDDAEAAREDFRRAMRLGRLLRQDDVTVIQDMVAIACIRIGAEAMYELAREEGDAASMTAAALVLTDKDAMRLMTARRITILERAVDVVNPEAPRPELRLTDAELDAIVDLIRELRERRFRIEGLIGLHVVKYLGTPSQREKAVELLDEMAASSDPLIAQQAREFRDSELDDAALREMLAAMG